ncbi:MAG: signal recognition particle-docking protein FtsY [Candidatus Eisenbacteria bacterium]|nr:signal recognition particle-docking protein FtsY [Candidatus Eisenbacteria bacterium]
MNLWSRFRQGLERTRDALAESVGGALGLRGTVDAGTRQRLEDALIAADVGPATAERLIARAEQRMREDDVDLGTGLEREAASMLGASGAGFEPGSERPWVMMMVGVNGVGKTSLAGKLAARFAREGRRTLLIAADTFRAAATEQLEVWAERAAVEMVRGRDGVDPASVVHDGLSAALARAVEIAIIDTAGRLHTRHNLMEELGKVRRVCARVVPGAPHDVMLVLDATLGQNGLQQAREFQRTTPITCLAINKLDGTARGGAVLAIADQLGLPIRVAGLGEGIDDWEPFDPEAFARGLFESHTA